MSYSDQSNTINKPKIHYTLAQIKRFLKKTMLITQSMIMDIKCGFYNAHVYTHSCNTKELKSRKPGFNLGSIVMMDKSFDSSVFAPIK